MRIITIARKPVSESNISLNVQKHGCGAIDIQGTRIGSEVRRSHIVDFSPVSGNRFGSGVSLPTIGVKEVSGRWPANVLLLHESECSVVGSVEVQSSEHRGLEQTPARSWKNASKAGINRVGYGKETVSTWDCSEGCPVHDLNSQSGVQKSGVAGSKSRAWGSGGEVVLSSEQDGVGWKAYGSEGYKDIGTAARYFKQFKRG